MPRLIHFFGLFSTTNTSLSSVIRQSDYDTKKNAKALPFDKTIATFEQQAKRVPWSFSEDGILRSGMSIMMKNKKTNGWLCMDVGER